MNNLALLEPKEFNNQKVVTFKDIDFVHQRPNGTAKRNFNKNKKRFIETIDYFIVKYSDNEKYENRTIQVISNRGEIFLTQTGYLMISKSFNDDLSWEVQRELVSNYFNRTKLLEQNFLVDTDDVFRKINVMDYRLENLEDNMVINYSKQLEINNLVKEVCLKILGGKKTIAYRELSKKVFSRIWTDFKEYFDVNSYRNTPSARFQDAIDYVGSWQPPMNLKKEIEQINKL